MLALSGLKYDRRWTTGLDYDRRASSLVLGGGMEHAVDIKQFVSPKITIEEWLAGKKSDIDVFEYQVQGWVFDQVDALLARPPAQAQHASHALLGLTTPYFEMITCYLTGQQTPRKQASEYLRRGLAVVLAGHGSAEAIKKYVSEVRNGIAHELMFRTVMLHQGFPRMPSFGIEPNTGVLAVDPFWLAKVTHAHFQAYVHRLRNPQNADDHTALQNFTAFMKVRKARGV